MMDDCMQAMSEPGSAARSRSLADHRLAQINGRPLNGAENSLLRLWLATTSKADAVD
jgi:hypothetical protein